MSPGATALVPSSSLDEDAWDDLISYIEERRVIPIIGPELLLVQTDQGPRLLHDWFAGKLALRLNVDVTQLPQPYTLNDVVCWFLGARGRREEACVRLRGILKDAAFEPPLALRQLAAIPEFDLFVTTSFDALLETPSTRRGSAGQGKLAESRQVIEAVVKLHRDLASRNRGDQNQKVEMAAALYAQALSDPGGGAALLRESQALLASLPARMSALNSVRRWTQRVREAAG
jgi:hypothetical protein